MRRVRVFTATIVMLSVAGCGPADAGPVVAPVRSAVAPVSSAVASAAPASPGAQAVRACRLAAAAPRAGEAVELDEPAVKAIIQSAGKSGVAGVERAGAQVQARYEAWLRADLGDEAANALDDLLDSVGLITRACAEAAVPS
ncbi:hypothetical protein [Actinoplanes sp. NPDC020271]|uniref:hypothetical protein n=1 Tax=Actinoplanes sp. NPDC020271 TaxID=3363896 RepID=UPI0037BCCC6A